MDIVAVILLSLAIILVAIISGAMALKRTRGSERGSLPGKGDHVIEANYSSGAGVGGHSTTYKIPRDPQEYAKRFIPREKRK